MKSVLTVLLVASLVMVAGIANAAQPAGQVPDATLAQLGLSGMQTMTDVQGADIRGTGFARVSGWSQSSAPGTATYNEYGAVSVKPICGPCGPALAAGGSISALAAGIGVITPFGNGAIIVGSASVGGAVAYAR